jgi:hypothetical protein
MEGLLDSGRWMGDVPPSISAELSDAGLPVNVRKAVRDDAAP